MANPRNHSPNAGFPVALNDSASFVSAERLKEVDAPSEGVLGALNSGFKAGVVSAAVSAAVTVGRGVSQQENVAQKIFRDMTHAHLPYIGGVTAGLALVGGTIRFRRAERHNEWSHKHYDLLAHTSGSFAERAEASRDESGPQR